MDGRIATCGNLHPYKIEISTAFRISVQLQALDWLGKCIALPLCCLKKLFDSCVVKNLQQTQLNHTRQSTLCLACSVTSLCLD